MNKGQWLGGHSHIRPDGTVFVGESSEIITKPGDQVPTRTVILQVQKSDSGREMSNSDYVTAKLDVGEETASPGVNDIKGPWHPVLQQSEVDCCKGQAALGFHRA